MSFPDARCVTREPSPSPRRIGAVGSPDDGSGTQNLTRLLGDVIARGTRSAVHAYGRDAVIKIPDRWTPGTWILAEAAYSAAVRDAGAPAPRLLGVEQFAGRPASVWERVPGPSMWECARERPDRCSEYGELLADLQLSLFELVPPVSLPRQRDRLVSKIRRSAELVDASLVTALSRLPPEAHPPRVCHGDLHPGNVILAGTGPVIVDWFDASRGDPVADFARSSLLMSSDDHVGVLPHLPGAGPGTLGVLARAHLTRVRSRLEVTDTLFERWRAVEAVARMAEDVPPVGLLETWRRFEGDGVGPAGPAT